MKINGAKIASKIKESIKAELRSLEKKGIVPKLAIVTLGPEDAWQIYVRQKIKFAQEFKIKTLLINFSENETDRVFDTVKKLDQDSNINGIIVQRPIPKNIDKEKIINAVSAQKDIDGFRQDSKFETPAWLAVKKIIEETQGFDNKKIAVMGKGETAGMPVIRGLRKMGINPEIIDSSTENPERILEEADIVISAVGKTIVNPATLKKGVLLIGIGVHRQEGKLQGDYFEENIALNDKDYTPTPGGVGPINLAYLFSNLIQAAKS